MTQHSSDLACRIAQRRQELGLSREELARRETTAVHLRGGDVDGPSGPGRAGAHPHLDVLSSEECEAHLAGGGVGRFVFLAPQGPVRAAAATRRVIHQTHST